MRTIAERLQRFDDNGKEDLARLARDARENARQVADEEINTQDDDEVGWRYNSRINGRRAVEIHLRPGQPSESVGLHFLNLDPAVVHAALGEINPDWIYRNLNRRFGAFWQVRRSSRRVEFLMGELIRRAAASP